MAKHTGPTGFYLHVKSTDFGLPSATAGSRALSKRLQPLSMIGVRSATCRFASRISTVLPARRSAARFDSLLDV